MLRKLFFLWFIGVGALSAETDTIRNILGDSGRISSEQAAEYERKAQAGDSDAQYKLGEYYYRKDNSKESFLIASKWLETAAEQGHSKAQLALGNLLSEGKMAIGYLFSRAPVDYPLALSWYRKAARQGNVDAYVAIGRMYEKGKGVRADEKQANAWYKQRMDVGDAKSFVMRGDGYLNGKYGLKIRMGKSLDAYGEACDLGNQYGCSMYAELKRKKEGMFFYSGRFFGFNLFFEVG